jgi:succinate dehydrogenase flavin-adding protein (antitoxin of CptAB toxin-antitoxin module)
MKELDVALTAYLDNTYLSSSEAEQQEFREILALQDPELYQLICRIGKDDRYDAIVQKIRHSIIS